MFMTFATSKHLNVFFGLSGCTAGLHRRASADPTTLLPGTKTVLFGPINCLVPVMNIFHFGSLGGQGFSERF